MKIASRSRPGPVDAVKFLAAERYFAVEWETGNISSSHRALDKMAIGLLNGSIEGGILILPSRSMYYYLTDRIGNFEEIEPFGEDIPELSETMIGMRGKALKQKYANYLDDMDKVLSECSRVLKKGRFCAIVIGTNDSQLSRVLKVPKQEVTGLNKIMVEMGKTKGLSHVRSLPRQIVGMANTLRHEYRFMPHLEFPY